MRRTFLLIHSMVIALGCGDSSDDTMVPDTGPSDAGPVAYTAQAIFRPASDPMPWGEAPFPDDLYLDGDGRVSLGSFPRDPGAFGDYHDSLLQTLSTLDGFGIVSPIFFPIEGDIDPASLPADAASSLGDAASVFLLDADPASATAFARVPVQVRWIPEQHLIAIRPADGYPLASGGTYAAVITNRVEAADGSALGPAERFTSIRDSDAEPTDELDREIRSRYEPVLSNLEGDELARSEVVALAVFTTQTIGAGLAKAREQAWEGDPPDLQIDEVIAEDRMDRRLGMPVEDLLGGDVEGGVVHQSIAFMIHGSYEAPNYLNATPFLHGSFEYDDEGSLIEKRAHRVPFTLFLPAVLENLPLVIFQHGLTVERSQSLPLAEVLCEAGYAVLAVDAPWHGMRASGSTVDQLNNFTGEEMSDSFGDLGGAGIVIDFAGVTDVLGPLIGFHPFYFRDAMRQAVADLMMGVRAIREGNWAPLATRDDRLGALSFAEQPAAFVGYSLGGIIGTMFVGTEPEVGCAVLHVTGGSLANLVGHSPWLLGAYFGQLFPLLNLQLDTVDYEVLHPSFFPEIALWQTLLDRGDSMSYAGAVRRSPAHVLMHMAREDETVPNVSTESLARAIGVPMTNGAPSYVDVAMASLPLRGNIAGSDGMRTRGLYVFEEANHSVGYLRAAQQTVERPVLPPFAYLEEPIEYENPIDEALTQIVRFLETWRAGVPEISSPPQ